jgi:hypothetical protein
MHPEIEQMNLHPFALFAACRGLGSFWTSFWPSYMNPRKKLITDGVGITGMEPIQHYLSRRANWQAGAQAGGARAEKDSVQILCDYLETTYPGQWSVTSHPTDLRQIYYEYDRERNPDAYLKPAAPTSEDVWYDEASGTFLTAGPKGKPKMAAGGGCLIDCKIEHLASGKKYFLECKNQEARGNAQERAAKYATPSIIAHVQKKLGVNYQPFGYLFTGGMVDSRDYILELKATYGFAPDHLFLWKKEHEPAALLQWLERSILPLLR